MIRREYILHKVENTNIAIFFSKLFIEIVHIFNNPKAKHKAITSPPQLLLVFIYRRVI